MPASSRPHCRGALAVGCGWLDASGSLPPPPPPGLALSPHRLCVACKRSCQLCAKKAPTEPACTHHSSCPLPREQVASAGVVLVRAGWGRARQQDGLWLVAACRRRCAARAAPAACALRQERAAVPTSGAGRPLRLPGWVLPRPEVSSTPEGLREGGLRVKSHLPRTAARHRPPNTRRLFTARPPSP